MLKSIIVGIEQRAGTLNQKQRNESLPYRFAASERGRRLIHTWVERINKLTDIKYPNRFEIEYLEAVREGCFPIIIANHDSHFSGVTLSLVAKKLTDLGNNVLYAEGRSNGFLMPTAASLATGHQDAGLKIMYEAVGPILDENHLRPVSMTRAKDVRRYGLQPNRKEYRYNMQKGIEIDGFKGIAIFPEGTVQAGRKNKQGKRFGMQPFKDGSIMENITFAKEFASEVVFVPVAVSGGYKVLDPDKNFPPPLKALAAGLGFGNPAIVKVNYGMPVRSSAEEVRQLILDAVNYEGRRKLDAFFGHTVASMLPPQERGVYAT